MLRRRTCTSPSPSDGGANCSGSDQQTKTCNSHLCPGNSCVPSALFEIGGIAHRPSTKMAAAN